METVELSPQDRERMDTLIGLIKHNREQDVVVSCTEAARLLGKTRKTVSMMLRDGRLKKVTIGESNGILLSAIQDLHQAQ